MAARVAWVLNLDADLELGALAAGRGGYNPTRAVLDAMRTHVPALAASLLGAGDILVDESSQPLVARGFIGRAFCPTPRALRILARAGAEPEPHPPAAVLARVNSRAFASELGATLPGAAFVDHLDAARAMLATAPAPFDAWRVKRAFAMTGRGQRVIVPPATAADLAFVAAAIDEGGVQIEPSVTITAEYAIHGMISAPASPGAGASSALTLGVVVRQRCDARGAWLATEPLHLASSDSASTLGNAALAGSPAHAAPRATLAPSRHPAHAAPASHAAAPASHAAPAAHPAPADRLSRKAAAAVSSAGRSTTAVPSAAPPLPLDLEQRLLAEAHRVAAALSAVGYFGPFGVDAYTYEQPGSTVMLQPRSEINARYSMGFAVGFPLRSLR